MTKIMDRPAATAEQMAAYLLARNPEPKIFMDVTAFCRLFLYLGALEGVRGDGLFAQSCWETNNFKYGGTVTPDQHNFAGIGTVSATEKGAHFPDEATGILAQAQHAKTYATKDALVFDCVDPRRTDWFVKAKGGTAQHWEELGGTWAVPGYDTKKYKSLEEANEAKDSYGYKITGILADILATPTGEAAEDKADSKPAKPLAGRKVCLDAGHYGKYNQSPGVAAYYESEAMWDLHLLLKKELEELGATVTRTRANQGTDLSLKKRGAKSVGCDAFLSLHTNAVGSSMNEGVDYVAVYHLTEDTTTKCDDASEELAKVLAPAISGVMGVKQGHKVLSRLASADSNGDGVLNDNYYGVLNGARSVGTPGLILEHSFHTNTKVAKWLLEGDNLAKLAKAEARAIAAYFAGADAPASAPVKSPTAPAGKVDAARSFDKSLAGVYKVNARSGLNLRAGASTSKDSLEVMALGSKFRCYGYHTDGWLYGVSESGKTGFCSKAYLDKQ